MNKNLSRRDFLKLSALSAAAAVLTRLTKKTGTAVAVTQQPQDDPVSVHYKPGVIYVEP